MAQSIVGSENVQPYKFSECSKKDYIDALRIGNGLCLLNKPNEVSVKIQVDDNKETKYIECNCADFIFRCINMRVV